MVHFVRFCLAGKPLEHVKIEPLNLQFVVFCRLFSYSYAQFVNTAFVKQWVVNFHIFWHALNALLLSFLTFYCLTCQVFRFFLGDLTETPQYSLQRTLEKAAQMERQQKHQVT